MNSPHYKSPLEGPNRGRGVASGFWFNVGLRSSVTVTRPAGRHGQPDRGQHRHRRHARLARDAARRNAGHPVRRREAHGRRHRLRRLQRRHRRQPRDLRLRAWPCYEAGNNLIKEMAGRLAAAWQTSRRTRSSSRTARSRSPDGSKTRHLQGDRRAGRRPRRRGSRSAARSTPASSQGGAFAHHIVDVEVDPDTGKTTVLRYTALQDVGTAVHPSYVEGQMQGGAVQGIGWALNEEYYYDDNGRWRTRASSTTACRPRSMSR